MPHKKKFKKDFSEFETFEEDDITGSDDEYSDGERQLLEKVRKKRAAENFDSDDEVYGLQNEDDDHDSMESEIERPQDDDLPDERAWGRSKRAYYSTDYVDPDYATTSERDMTAAAEEEEAARSIQQRLAEQLDDADVSLEISSSVEAEEEPGAKEILKTDLSKMSRSEKLAMVQKDNPEFRALVDDFKERMSEVTNVLAPFLQLVDRQNLLDCPAISLLRTKYQLILNYCVNITFYLMLKAKKIPVQNHPVLKRLAQYRQLIIQLEEGQGKLVVEAAEVLEASRRGQVLYSTVDSSEITQPEEKKRAVSMSESVEDEEDEASDEPMEEDELGPQEVTEEANLEDEKRPINYQIAKNKGLTPYRKKELRNPRVKHRNKYRKAKIRRKGAVRDVRKELTRYDGERSGIKASVKKSIRIK